MKKGKILLFIILFVQFILITGSINAIQLPIDYKEIEKTGSKTIEIIQQFSIPIVKDTNEFITIHLKEANSFAMNTGDPILPTYLQTVEFPLGTHVKEIQCLYSDVDALSLSKKITPAKKPIQQHQN